MPTDRPRIDELPEVKAVLRRELNDIITWTISVQVACPDVATELQAAINVVGRVRDMLSDEVD